MNIKDELRRMALIKAFTDALMDFTKEERANVLTNLLEKYEDEGTKSFNVTLPNGQKVASITLPEGKPVDKTVDEAALYEWAEAQGGIDVEVIPAVAERTVKKIRASWLADRIKRSIEGDDGDLIDVESGEVIEGIKRVPGASPSSFSVLFAKDGREKLATAYRRGELNELVAGTALPQIASMEHEAAA
jgi:hypothetical protein